MSLCPQALTLEGRSAHYQGQGHKMNLREIHHFEQKCGVKGYFTKTLKCNIPHLFIK